MNRRHVLWLTMAGVMSSALVWAVAHHLRARAPVELPAVEPKPISILFTRPPSIPITITAEWLKVPVNATPGAIHTDPALWRRMHFDDWDTVPSPLRERGMKRMVATYGRLLRDPRQWDRMSADDWDAVPQPIRAIAFMQMMRYWSGYYQVGASHGLPRGTITDTLNAIMMVESWFEHRAMSTSRSGNRDLGVGQTSDFARAALARLFRTGTIDFAPEADAGYFDPWQATRMTAIWFDLMLDEQRGDLDAAIRAYHRGAFFVNTEMAESYLSNVRQKRRRFMRERSGTPAWQLLISLTRETS